MLTIVFFLMECIILSFMDSCGIDDANPILLTAFIIVIFISFAIDVSKIKVFRSYFVPLVLGFFVRITLMYWDLYGREIFPLIHSGGDSENYYAHSLLFAETGESSYGGIFPDFMGSIFKLIGNSRLYGQFIILMFSVLTLCVIVLILKELQISYKVGFNTLLITSVLPNFAILSSIYLRESVIILLNTISLLYFIKWMRYFKDRFFLIACVFGILATLFHSGGIAVVAGYAVVYLLYDKKKNILKLRFKSIIPIIIYLLIFAYFFYDVADVLFSKFSRVDAIEDVAAVRADGGSSYAQYVGNSNSIQNMIIYSIPRMVYFLFSPFPWQWRGIADMISFFSTSFLYICVIFKGLLNIKSSKNKVVIQSLVIIISIFSLIFGFGVTAFGTAMRHRDKIIAVFIIIYALAQDNTQQIHAHRQFRGD